MKECTEIILRGIGNCLGVWYNGLRVPWKRSNNFSLFQLEKTQFLQKKCLLTIYGFHSENIFWEKDIKKLQFRTILLPYKKVCY